MIGNSYYEMVKDDKRLLCGHYHLCNAIFYTTKPSRKNVKYPQYLNKMSYFDVISHNLLQTIIF